MDRITIQKTYIRICQDSGFKIDWVAAACLAAKTLKITPVDVWASFSGVNQMIRISDGEDIPIYA
jgi:hypothetical protein